MKIYENIIGWVCRRIKRVPFAVWYAVIGVYLDEEVRAMEKDRLSKAAASCSNRTKSKSKYGFYWHLRSVGKATRNCYK